MRSLGPSYMVSNPVLKLRCPRFRSCNQMLGALGPALGKLAGCNFVSRDCELGRNRQLRMVDRHSRMRLIYFYLYIVLQVFEAWCDIPNHSVMVTFFHVCSTILVHLAYSCRHRVR